MRGSSVRGPGSRGRRGGSRRAGLKRAGLSWRAVVLRTCRRMSLTVLTARISEKAQPSFEKRANVARIS